MGISQRDFLVEVLCGDLPAVDFCGRLGALSQVIDDIIDEPELVVKWSVLDAFHTALFVIPEHPFYQQHRDTLAPIMHAAFMAWADSTQMEGGAVHDRILAYSLRDKLTDVVVHCAMLVGGYEHAIFQGPDIRRFFMDEPLHEYLTEAKSG